MALVAGTYALVLKDVQSEWRTRYSLNALMMFVVTAVAIMLFAIRSVDPNPELLAGMFWVVIFFTAMSGMSRSFVAEEERGTSLTLQLVASPSVVYSGKLLFNGGLIILLSLIITFLFKLLFAGFVVKSPAIFFPVVLLGSLGFASASTIVAAIIAKTSARGTLYAVLLFPILIVPLMTSMGATAKTLDGSSLSEVLPDIQVLVGYLLVLVGGSALVFEYIWKE